MQTNANPSFRILALAWLGLVLLTLVSLGLGQWFRGIASLPWWIAGLIWAKGAVVGMAFIGTRGCHPFIRRLIHGFILLPPAGLLLTAYFGPTLARWASL